MGPEDDDFEFELEDDDEDQDDDGSSKKQPSGKKAKMTPIPDGVKRRMAQYLSQISRLKVEVKEYRDEKDSYEGELELLEDEIENLRSEKDRSEEDINKQVALTNAYEKKLNRNQKDFTNYKKRTDSEIDRRVKQGSKKFFIGLIDVLDNLERAILEAEKIKTPETKQILVGVGSIKKGMLRILEDNGVTVIDPIDEVFDPKYHEAFEMREDPSIPDNTVVLVDSKGYLLGDMVLRPAKVIVSKGGRSRAKKKRKEDPEGDVVLRSRKVVVSKGERQKKKKEDSKEEENDISEIDEVEEVGEMEELLEEVEELDEG